jgi:hypothetical protein
LINYFKLNNNFIIFDSKGDYDLKILEEDKANNKNSIIKI